MERMLPGQHEDDYDGRRGCSALEINGETFANTAAKFWSSLIDEARHDYPALTAIELSAPSGELITEEHLDPMVTLEKAMNCLFKSDMTAVMEDAVRELEMFGPPSPVSIRLLADEKELMAGELSSEIADEEIFICLAAWLLKWGGLPESLWNSEFLDGCFRANGRKEDRQYEVSFNLHNLHMSEGLFQRTLKVEGSCSDQ